MADGRNRSVCSVGIVIVRGGEIADSYYSLIKPEPEYYSYWNTRVHDLTQEDTMNAVTTSPCITMPWQMPKPVPG